VSVGYTTEGKVVIPTTDQNGTATMVAIVEPDDARRFADGAAASAEAVGG
jgi:hypothetical protein